MTRLLLRTSSPPRSCCVHAEEPSKQKTTSPFPRAATKANSEVFSTQIFHSSCFIERGMGTFCTPSLHHFGTAMEWQSYGVAPLPPLESRPYADTRDFTSALPFLLQAESDDHLDLGASKIKVSSLRSTKLAGQAVPYVCVNCVRGPHRVPEAVARSSCPHTNPHRA